MRTKLRFTVIHKKTGLEMASNRVKMDGRGFVYVDGMAINSMKEWPKKLELKVETDICNAMATGVCMKMKDKCRDCVMKDEIKEELKGQG